MREDHTDMTDVYNTHLSEADEKKFQKWVKAESKKQGRDVSLDLGNYDLRGFWKSRSKRDERGHGSDRYKKPNHPTFSDESKYHDVDGHHGGRWMKRGEQNVFVPGSSNRKYWRRKMLKQYFDLYEPETELVWDI